MCKNYHNNWHNFRKNASTASSILFYFCEHNLSTMAFRCGQNYTDSKNMLKT